ncbi:hypothetical protein ABPG74_010654 [Tetrahymena malaccensis]
MGNSQANQKENQDQYKGGIFIQIPKTNYTSGELIEGTLHLSVLKQYQGHMLTVCLEGIEETHFTYTINKIGVKPSHHKIEKHIGEGSKVFLNLAVPLYDFQNGDNNNQFMLMPGQFQIPFQIQTSANLPSSFKFKQDEENYCSLKYTLKAFIIPLVVSDEKIEGFQEIAIRQQEKKDQEQELPYTHLTTEPFYCCCAYGSYHQKLSLQESYYSPGQTIDATIDCDFSKFDEKVSQVEISLYGILNMKSVSDPIRNKFIGLQQISYEAKVENKKCQQVVKIDIPDNYPTSIEGELINVQFYVDVTPIIQSCCLEQQTPLKLDVYINPKQNDNLPEQRQIERPQNWNPNILAVQTFDQQQAAEFQNQKLKFFKENGDNQIQSNLMNKPEMENPLI